MQEVWSQSFNTVGSTLVDLGFTFVYRYIPAPSSPEEYSQLATVSSLQRLSYDSPNTNPDMAWVKDTGGNDNWIEADFAAYEPGVVSQYTNYLTAGASVDPDTGRLNHFGSSIQVSTNTGQVTLFDHTTTLANLNLPYMPARIRIENKGETVRLFYGPVGLPNPTTPLGNPKGYSTNVEAKGPYTGFLVRGAFSTLGTNVIDNVASGRFSIIRFIDSRSPTFSDVIPPVDIVWTEDFGNVVGWPLTSLGFLFETTETNGSTQTANPSSATIGSNHALTFESSVNSPAIWFKTVGSKEHYIECDLLKYPFTRQYPLILRAFSPEHFIGILVTTSDIRLVSRYAGTDTVMATVSKSKFTLPIRIRIEARNDWVYATWGPAGYPNPVNHFTYVGSPKGYFINKNITPALLTSFRTGVGRMESTQITNFADNYQSGFAYIPSTVIAEQNQSLNLSLTKADSPIIDSIAKPIGSDATSKTSSDMPVVTIENNVFIDDAKSETRSDEGTIKFYGPSVIFPLGARSETRGLDVPINAQYLINGEDARSKTKTDLIGTSSGSESYQAINVTPAESKTRTDYLEVVPEAIIDIQETRSTTFGNATFAFVRVSVTFDDARSETIADQIETNDAGKYRPWLFT